MRGKPIHLFRDIYANKLVKLGEIEVIGFDYDYTICQYSNNLIELIYRHARDYLIDNLGYN